MSHRWALIGIDYYEDSPLHGAVRDVKLIQEFLQSDDPSIRITCLTASFSSEPNASGPFEEADGQLLPTYRNTCASLRFILEESRSGDLIYIHYSGHGSRTYGDDREHSDKNTGDLALELYDKRAGARRLRGVELASFLRKMVDKGLIVTVVLDCCFSGSVLRDSKEGKWEEKDVRVRSLRHNREADSHYYPQSTANENISASDRGTSRDASIYDWLIKPEGYTILAACGPDELAFELKIGGDESHGALSYFLLSALVELQRSGTMITHQILYQRLSFKFRVEWRRQCPMRYGNRDLPFFQRATRQIQEESYVPVTLHEEGLLLGCGSAHGVHTGDEWALYPLTGSRPVSGKSRESYWKAKVIKTYGLTSILEEVGTGLPENLEKYQLKAELLTRLAPWKMVANIRCKMEEGELTESLSHSKQGSLLQLSVGNEILQGSDPLVVTCNNQREVEICDGAGKRLQGIPKLTLSSKAMVEQMLRYLDHISTFKFFERLQNRMPNPAFLQSYQITVDPPSGPEGYVAVREKHQVAITIQNLSTEKLYITLFDMGPCWHIRNLFCASGRGESRVLLPRDEDATGQETFRPRMSIPSSLKEIGLEECEDTLKLFITRQPSSFSMLELPRLMPFHSASRGTAEQVSRFFSNTEAVVRDSDCDIKEEEWATWEIFVRTTAS